MLGRLEVLLDWARQAEASSVGLRARVQVLNADILEKLDLIRGTEPFENLPCIEHFPSSLRFQAIIHRIEALLRRNGSLKDDEMLVPREPRYLKFLEWLRKAKGGP